MHPLRKSSAGALIVDIHPLSEARNEAGIEESISFIAAIGSSIDRLQARVAEQNGTIAALRKEVSDLEMHKEAAYGEMAKTESALRAERERAARFEQLYQQALKQDHDSQERINRLVTGVRETFDRAQSAVAT